MAKPLPPDTELQVKELYEEMRQHHRLPRVREHLQALTEFLGKRQASVLDTLAMVAYMLDELECEVHNAVPVPYAVSLAALSLRQDCGIILSYPPAKPKDEAIH